MTKISHERGGRYRFVLPIIGAVFALAVTAHSGAAGKVAAALDELAANSVVSEQTSLQDIGITEAIILNGTNERRDIRLPVPPGVALTDTMLELDGRFMHAGNDPTKFTVSLDGYAVSARVLSGAKGDAGLRIGVDGSPRPDGTILLGLAWTPDSPEGSRKDEGLGQNILEIFPTTRITYLYDSLQIQSLPSVWASMPSAVTMLIARGPLDKTSYETAWRVAMAADHSGRRVTIRQFPGVGDEIDLSSFRVPKGLQHIPAFAALGEKGRHTIADSAEIGALMLLRGEDIRPHIVIADAALSAEIKASFDALWMQVKSADASAEDAFSRLREGRSSIDAAVSGAGTEAQLVMFAGRPVIGIKPVSGTQGFANVELSLTPAGTTPANTNENPVSGDGTDSLSLAVFGSSPNRLDVATRANWTADFILGGAGTIGKVPRDVDLHISAAAGASQTPLVAAVYVNDYLLGARRLDANGKMEKIEARIPSYALQLRNILRVEFQREESSSKEAPTWPVAVLPGSRLHLAPAPVAEEFVGLIPWFAGETSVFISDAWLDHPVDTIPTLVKVTSASAAAIDRAAFHAVAATTPVTVKTPFIAFDVPVGGASDAVEVRDDHIVLTRGDGAVLHDVQGLDDLAVIQVATADGHSGMLYRTIGPKQLRITESFQFGRADVALLNAHGIQIQVNTRGEAVFPPDDHELLSAERTRSWVGILPWMLPLVAMTGFILLLILARHARRRHSDH